MKLCVIFTMFLMLTGCLASNNEQQKTQVVIQNTFGLLQNMPDIFLMLPGFEVTYHGFRKELARQTEEDLYNLYGVCRADRETEDF